MTGMFGWSRQGQISAPAVWGKLPSHADFVQSGVKNGEIAAWQEWFTQQLRPLARPVLAAQMQAGEQWTHLDTVPGPGAPSRREGQSPVAFVLAPGTLAFAPQEHVLGVVAPSNDRLGREHPILVYQRASVAWLRKHLEGGEACLVQRWLFVLSRLIRGYQSPEVPAPAMAGHASATPASLALADAVARLWGLHSPRRWSWLGTPAPVATRELLARAPFADMALSAMLTELSCGNAQLPWADWPQRLWAQQPPNAFWQQDVAGHFVGASVRLDELWRCR